LEFQEDLQPDHRHRPCLDEALHGGVVCCYGGTASGILDHIDLVTGGDGAREFDHLGVAPQLPTGTLQPIGPKLQRLRCGYLVSIPCRGTGLRKA
jgi:hypothetical protein